MRGEPGFDPIGEQQDVGREGDLERREHEPAELPQSPLSDEPSERRREHEALTKYEKKQRGRAERKADPWWQAEIARRRSMPPPSREELIDELGELMYVAPHRRYWDIWPFPGPGKEQAQKDRVHEWTDRMSNEELRGAVRQVRKRLLRQQKAAARELRKELRERPIGLVTDW